MKITPSKNRNQGNVLLVAIMAAVTVSFILVSYLKMISNQHMTVARAEAWNSALPLVEAGIEVALTQIQIHGISSTRKYSPSTLSAEWGSLTKSNSLGSAFYKVTIFTNSTYPVIDSYGYVPTPLHSGQLVRRVKVTTIPLGMFDYAMLAKSNLVYGGGITIRSFTGTVFSTNNLTANANVASNRNVTNDTILGNGTIDIYGNVATGPDAGTDFGQNTTITGSITHDANMDILDAPYPTNGFSWPGIPTIVKATSTYYLTGASYRTADFTLKPSETLLITNHTELWVTGNFTSKGTILITNGGSLTIYNGTTNSSLPTTVDINGNGVINGSGIATNFIVYGLPSNNDFKLSGGSAFTGIIYAPYAALTMTGGGNFYGSTTTYSAKVTGNYNFFYPEFLKSLYVNQFVITSWNELPP